MKLRLLSVAQRVLLALGILTLMASFVFASAQSVFAASLQNDAMVRVVHAAPGAGTVDVFVDGNKLLSNFAFGTVTGYVNLPAGSHQIQVAPAGKGASAAVITQTVSVDAGVPYTVAAIGTTSFSLAAFVDDNQLSGAMAKVRVYHLSPDAGPVNVAVGGNTVITGLTYKNASSYLNVPAGAYTFDVTATDSGAKVPVAATLSSGMVSSVFAIGLLKGTPALSFKLASVAGVPGMPNTGSDPNAVPVSQPNNLWLPISTAFALLLIGSGIAVRRYAFVHKK